MKAYEKITSIIRISRYLSKHQSYLDYEDLWLSNECGTFLLAERPDEVTYLDLAVSAVHAVVVSAVAEDRTHEAVVVAVVFFRR